MDFPKWFAEMIKRNAQPQPMSAATEAVDTQTVYIGPKGGKYRFNAKGKKIYLSA